MIKRRSRVVFLLLGGIALLVVLSVIGNRSGVNRYILPAEAIYRGDLTVAAQDVELEPGSVVQGNVSIVAVGHVRLAGRIDGKLSILAPNSEVWLGESLSVGGDLAVCARSLSPANLEKIAVTGRRDSGCDKIGSLLSGVPVPSQLPTIQLPIFSRYTGDFLSRLIQIITTSLSVAAVAALLNVIFPRQLRRMLEAMRYAPRTAGVVGFLSMGAASGLTLVYLALTAITLGLLCVLLPLVAVGWAVITGALVLGWIVVAYPLGGLLMRRFNLHGPPMIAAALGALALTFVQGILESLPCVGWLGGLMLVILGSVGLGTVLLTRLGTRPYPEFVPQA